ncbi:MAG: hypothetical protein AB8G18_11975 [Gammaproteobacteria bacterium]
MMKRFLILLLLSTFCAVPLAQAQDPAPTPPTTASPAQAEAEEEEEDDNFRPTEKINVDSSVSFPVDI